MIRNKKEIIEFIKRSNERALYLRNKEIKRQIKIDTKKIKELIK